MSTTIKQYRDELGVEMEIYTSNGVVIFISEGGKGYKFRLNEANLEDFILGLKEAAQVAGIKLVNV